MGLLRRPRVRRGSSLAPRQPASYHRSVPKQIPNTTRGKGFGPPPLQTFVEPASWCNSRGHIDRSACVEVRISEVRRLAKSVIEDGARREDGKGRTQLVSPLPDERPARNVHGRVATGVFVIHPYLIYRLHCTRQPRGLAGDWRTHRAPVMRRAHHDSDGPFPQRVETNGPPVLPFDRALEGNPNRGAARTKILGVHDDFSQPLRIEKWIFPKRIRPAYYLICPGTLLRNSDRDGARGSQSPEQGDRRKGDRDRDRGDLLPGLSTCKPGRKASGCAQRALKLMMVQCTMQEKLDADLAQLWLRSLPIAARRAQREAIDRIVQRYGPIMEPRCLLCPRCLGVKYGNHPETVRQGWRRRQGKENARAGKGGKKAEPVEKVPAHSAISE